MPVVDSKPAWPYVKLAKLGEGTKILRRFEVLTLGTYGKVYKAVNTKTGELVALKKLKYEHLDDEGIPPTSIREISLLHEPKHRTVRECWTCCRNSNVVLRMLEVQWHKKDLYICFEYMEFDLGHYLKKKPALSAKRALEHPYFDSLRKSKLR